MPRYKLCCVVGGCWYHRGRLTNDAKKKGEKEHLDGEGVRARVMFSYYILSAHVGAWRVLCTHF